MKNTQRLSLILVFAVASIVHGKAAAQSQAAPPATSSGVKDRAKASSAVETELIRRDRQWIQAEIGGDEATLQDVLSDDLLATDSTGQLQTKAEYIAAILTGHVHWTKSDPDEYQVHVYGDTAVMIHRTSVQGSVDGHTVDGYSRATHVWHREHGVWRVVAQQITRIPPQSPPAQ